MILEVYNYWIGGPKEGLNDVNLERRFDDFEEACKWACDITYNHKERVILKIVDTATGQSEQF